MVVNLALDEETRARAADLTLIKENPDLHAFDRALEIAVGKEDVRGLAAELERRGNETFGRGLRDVDAHFGRAREGELVKARVLEHCVARGAAGTRDDVHDPGGNVAGDDFGEMQKRERGGRGGLDHDRVARGERRSELPSAHEEREVPGNDLTHDADRFVQDETHGVVVDAHGAAFFGAQTARKVAKVVDRERHVDERRLADGLAVVHRFDLREEVGFFLEIVGDAQKNGGALGGRGLRPAFKSGAGGLHRAVHVGGRSRGHAGEHFARGGIARFRGLAAFRSHPFTADQKTVFVASFHDCSSKVKPAATRKHDFSQCCGRVFTFDSPPGTVVCESSEGGKFGVRVFV